MFLSITAKTPLIQKSSIVLALTGWGSQVQLGEVQPQTADGSADSLLWLQLSDLTRWTLFKLLWPACSSCLLSKTLCNQPPCPAPPFYVVCDLINAIIVVSDVCSILYPEDNWKSSKWKSLSLFTICASTYSMMLVLTSKQQVKSQTQNSFDSRPAPNIRFVVAMYVACLPAWKHTLRCVATSK